jgi:hypothetical protein
VAYFPWYDTGHIENDAFNSSIVARIRYRSKVSTEPLPSNDRRIFTEPLPSNDKGNFTEPLPGNYKRISTEQLLGNDKADFYRAVARQRQKGIHIRTAT